MYIKIHVNYRYSVYQKLSCKDEVEVINYGFIVTFRRARETGVLRLVDEGFQGVRHIVVRERGQDGGLLCVIDMEIH